MDEQAGRVQLQALPAVVPLPVRRVA